MKKAHVTALYFFLVLLLDFSLNYFLVYIHCGVEENLDHSAVEYEIHSSMFVGYQLVSHLVSELLTDFLKAYLTSYNSTIFIDKAA